MNHFDRDLNPRAVVDIHGKDYPSAGSWGRAARIQLPDANLLHGDQIISVACAGETIFAGFSSMEKVLVIQLNAVGANDWQVTQTLQAPDGSLFDHFGESLSADGEWLSVGAPFENEAANNKGSVYLFRRIANQWTFFQKLLPPVSSLAFSFGKRLSLSGGWLAIGDQAYDVTLYRHNGSGQWSYASSHFSTAVVTEGSAAGFTNGYAVSLRMVEAFHFLAEHGY